jgi:hypothetical protein
VVWTRTLANLVSDVTYRADIEGQTARHPLATVRRRLIESYQAFREMMIVAGSKRFASYYTIGVGTGVTPASLGYGTQLRLSTSTSPIVPLEHPQVVEAYVNNLWMPLDCIDMPEASQWRTRSTATPAAWCLIGPPSGDPITDETANGGMFSLLILPAFDTAVYPIRVWAAPVVNVTDSDSTTLTLDSPGFEWLIWDTVVKVCARDNDSTNTYQIAQIEREKVEKRLIDSVRAERKATAQRSDVFGGNARNRWRRRWF